MKILIVVNFVRTKTFHKNIIYAKLVLIKFYAKNVIMSTVIKMILLNLILIPLAKFIIIPMKAIALCAKKINAHIVQ